LVVVALQVRTVLYNINEYVHPTDKIDANRAARHFPWCVLWRGGAAARRRGGVAV
jgi:hypothetical protein